MKPTTFEKVSRLFAKHTKADELYVASDNQVFFNENDAIGHSKSRAFEGMPTEIEKVTRARLAEIKAAAEAPANEPTVVEAPVTEAPATEPAVVEAPVTEAPTEAAPVAEVKTTKNNKKAALPE